MGSYQITEEEGLTLIALIESNPHWQVEELYHQLCAEFGSGEDHDEEAGIIEDLNARDGLPDPHRRFQMFTREGNAHVSALVDEIRWQAAAGYFHNRAEMAEYTRSLMDEMGKWPITAEIHDTEPRNAIADELDAICRDKGWAYDKWDSGL